MTHQYDLRPMKRFITGHDAGGNSVFLNVINNLLIIKDHEMLPLEGTDTPAKIGLAYATNEFPPDLHEMGDIKAYQQILEDDPFMVKNGIIFRVLDFPPGSTAPMHRTQTIDFGILIEGSVIATMDSGETQLLERGDSVIQRATNHGWANASETQWARMLFILNDAKV